MCGMLGMFFFTGGELLNNQRDIAYSSRSPHRLTNGNAATTTTAAAALMSSLGGAAASMMSSTSGELYFSLIQLRHTALLRVVSVSNCVVGFFIHHDDFDIIYVMILLVSYEDNN